MIKGLLKKCKIRIKRIIRRFVPQKMIARRWHYRILGKPINLKNPVSFSDKLEWYKLYYRDELMRTCTDKASVRDYVESCGYGHLLNECYGVYDSVEDIDWNKLPSRFVLKNTLGGSGKGVLLIFDKDKMDLESATKTMKWWLESCSYCKTYAGEWVYEDRKARIIAEKLLIDAPETDLPDYKFFCFHGHVFCSYLMRGCSAKSDRHVGEVAILDRDFKLLPARRADFHQIMEQPQKPKNYETMVEIAEKLSEPFPHVRVDFYNLDGTIIFGELTFLVLHGTLGDESLTSGRDK